MSYHCELLKASKYYGRHAKGWVCLINGHPHHCTGPTAKADAQSIKAHFSQPVQLLLS